METKLKVRKKTFKAMLTVKHCITEFAHWIL